MKINGNINIVLKKKYEKEVKKTINEINCKILS